MLSNAACWQVLLTKKEQPIYAKRQFQNVDRSTGWTAMPFCLSYEVVPSSVQSVQDQAVGSSLRACAPWLRLRWRFGKTKDYVHCYLAKNLKTTAVQQ